MAKRPSEPVRETTPKRFPEVTPTAYTEAVGATYLVESMMQMQQSLGELKATVGHLKSASDKQSTKLDRISHIIFAAGVVLAIILGIGGFLLNKIWDGVFAILTNPQLTQHSMTALPPPPPPTNPQAPPKNGQ
jgi:hypothetical protein